MAGLLSSLPGVVAALLAVVALIVLCGWAARLLRHGRVPAAVNRRLSIRAALALDPRRRLLLVACDDDEILLLTGGPQDLVIHRVPHPARSA